MAGSKLGSMYLDGEVIIRQGEEGDRMFVIQSGRVRVTREAGASEVHLADLGEGDIFGEMALFEREVRSATVRALGEARVLSIDKAGFLRKVHEDPSLTYRILQQMSRRIREINAELARLKADMLNAS